MWAAYSDTMSPPAAFTYRVRAFNAVGNSDYSNEATPGGLLTPTAISMPGMLAEARDFLILFVRLPLFRAIILSAIFSPRDAPATFVLYTLDGRVNAKFYHDAKKGRMSFLGQVTARSSIDLLFRNAHAQSIHRRCPHGQNPLTARVNVSYHKNNRFVHYSEHNDSVKNGITGRWRKFHYIKGKDIKHRIFLSGFPGKGRWK